MAKQLNINLAMTADSSKARAELQKLQKSLQDLMMSASRNDSTLGLSTEIQKSIQLAGQLKTQLQQATLPNGNLDLTRFNQGLKKSGLQLKDYRVALSSLGPEGAATFSKLASSIMQAEVPLRRSSALLSNFATSLKNTARWQISSSILHGFMGALQGAYGYAQDLNKSLNNIRIVTGHSVEDMSKFAIEANKAAKALSTTTTAYTDAALIYYQQGLSDKDVKARTDVTIKMANVTRQSAEEVSSQMTAIWNNFAKGSDNLEHFGDVITLLGARTAASSDEIVDGLSKFAAVADTVGLSYDKAAAAVATVVAETRQSADIVGTAFKTIFARLEGLNLGETLDDGVTLNKYSKALATVGVNILDQQGQLKEMDSILDELGDKWVSLGESQKVALAETVAGTRQYAQFMALMNNYDKISANQNIAKNADGTLQKQADIYAESWEAASKRVKAAAQGIYDDLLDDEFFIKMLNNIEKIITFFDKLIDNAGGLKGVLITLGSIMTTVFGPQIQASINNIVAGIASMTPKGQKNANNLREQATAELGQMAMQMTNSRGSVQQGQGMQAAYETQAKLQQDLLDNARFMTEEEKQRAQYILDINNNLGQEAIEAGKIADAKERELKALGSTQLNEAKRQNSGTIDQNAVKNAREVQKSIAGSAKSVELLRSVSSQVGSTFNDVSKSLKVGDSETKKMVTNFKNIASAGLDRLKSIDFGEFGPDAETEDKMRRLEEIIKLCGDDFEALDQTTLDQLALEIQSINDEFETAANNIEENLQTNGINNLSNAYQNVGMEATAATTAAKQFVTGAQTVGTASVDASDKVIALKNGAEASSEAFKKMGVASVSFGATLSNTISLTMNLASAINAVKTIGSIWNDDSISAGEKMLQIMMSLGAILPLITTLTNRQKIAELSMAAAKMLGMAGTKAQTAAEGLSIPVKIASGEAGYFALGPLLIFVAIAAAVVGAILLIAKALGSIDTNAKKAARAAEAAEKLGEAAKEAQDRVESLRQAFDKYDSAVKKLKECTKGTQEWKEALKEVNDTVMSIIQEYPELSGILDITREDGQLSINNIDEILAAAQSRADTLQIASIAANARAADAALTVQGDNLREKAINDYLYSGNVEDFQTRQNIINNASNYSDYTLEEFKKLTGTLGMTDSQFEDFYHSIKNLADQTDNVAHQMENAAQLMAAEAIKDANYDEQFGTEVANAIQTYTAEQSKQLQNKIYDKIIKEDADKNAQIDKQTSTSKAIWNRYLTAIGANPGEYTAAKNQIQGTDSNRVYAYTQKGVSGEQTISIEEMANTIAAYETMQQLGDVAKDLANKFSGMNEEARQFSASLINTKDDKGKYNYNDVLENFTEDQLKQLISGGDIGKVLGMTSEEIEALSAALGISLEDFEKNIQEAAGEVQSSIRDIGSDLSKTPKEAFDKLDLSDLTVAEQKKIAEAYKNIFEQGDSKALNAADEFLNQFKNFELEDGTITNFSDEVAEILNSVDWSNWDVDEELKTLFENANIPIPDNFEDFVNKMRDANDAVKTIDLTTFRKTFGEIQKIIDDIKIGDTISAEDYAKLGEGYADYFQLMADGTYKLVGDAKAFSEAVQETQRSDLLEGLIANQDSINKGQDRFDKATKALDGRTIANISKTGAGSGGEGYYSTDFVGDQINFLKEMGYNEDEIANWEEALKANGEWQSVDTAILDEIGKAVIATSADYEGWNNVLEETKKQQKETTEALFSTATSLEDLNEIQQLLIDSNIDAEIYTEAYSKQVHSLGINALNAAKSMDEIENVMDTYGITAEEAAPQIISLASNLQELNAFNAEFDLSKINPEAYAEKFLELATNISEVKQAFDNGIISADQYDAKLTELANNASSLQELQQIRSFGDSEDTGLDTYEYGQALLKLASNFENAANECYEYNQALLSGDENQIKAAESALELAVQTGELAKKFGFDAQTTENYSKRLAESFEEQGMSQAAATKLGLQAAIANQRLDRGLLNLNKNLDDYKTKLKESNKNSAEWSSTMDSLKTDLADILNVDITTLTDDFGEAVLESKDLQKALDGDVEAIQRLQTQAAEGMMLEIRNNLPENSQELAIFESQWEYLKANMAEAIESPGIDQSNLINSFNAMIEAGNMTKEQIEAALAGLHVSANVHTNYVPQTVTVPQTITEEFTEDAGTQRVMVPDANSEAGWRPMDLPLTRKITRTYDAGTVEVNGVVPQYTIEGTEGPGGVTTGFVSAPAPKASFSSTKSGGAGGKSGGGGGGKSPTKKAIEKKNDESERYHVVRAQIEDLTKEYDAASKAKDRLFGAARLQMLDKEIAATDKLAKKQKQYLDEIEQYRKSDFSALTSTGKKNGIQYTVEDANGNQKLKTANVLGLKDWLGMDVIADPNGVITNYDQIMEAAKNWYNKKIDEYNAMSASQQEAADKNGWKDLVEGQYSGFMDLLKQYEETNDLWEEEFQKLLDKYREKQDLELEKFQYKIEINVKLNDAEIKRLEYIRKSLADDRWKSVEYLMTIWNNEGKNSTYQQLLEQGGIHAAAAEELLGASHGDVQLDANGNVISQPQYSDAGWLEALDQEEEAIYNNIDALYDLDDQMVHYYEETLSNANEKLNQYMTKLEDCTALLEHYKTLMGLIDKQDSEYYARMDKLLKAQQQTAANEYARAEQEYELAEKRYREMFAEYENTDWTGNEAGKQKMEEQLQAAYEHMTEWQDKALSKAEALAEAIKAVYENAVEGASHEMEMALTGGMGFDELSNSIDRASSTADLLLTKTNQIYETNKLMRQLSQDIDKIDSAAAKTKLKNFRDEIQDMQNMNEMTKFDLEVAKARYEVLKAQIALEEAQNAKSTVRLQRDNEGNYGYVYTADQDKINDTRQQLEDKQNDLYNLTLEKANESAQALIQLDQDYVAELNRINTEYANDEARRQELLAQLEEEYLRKREILEKDAATANYWLNETAATDTSEAWGNAYKDIIADTDTWKTESEKYIGAVNAAHKQYQQDIDNTVKPAVDRLDEAIGKATQDSEKYSQWFEDFANNNDSNLKAISDITNEYFKQRQEIIALIQQLNNYIAQIDAARRALAQLQAQEQQPKDRSSSSQSGTGATLPTSSGNGGSGSGNSGPGNSGGTSSSSPKPTPSSGNVIWKVRLNKRSGGYNIASSGDESSARACFNVEKGKASNANKYSSVELLRNNTIVDSYTFKTSSGGGCFTGDSQIIMGDYTFKKLKDVKINDYVLAYNEEKKYFEIEQVLDIYIQHKAYSVVDVYLSNGEILKMTPSHPLLTSQGWKSLDIEKALFEHGLETTLLKVNDIILGFGTYGKVEKIIYEDMSKDIEVYTLMVNNCHTFIVNNMIVHNMPMVNASAKYASGGYTGEWIGGSQLDNGKLAILHQKELVLNEDDTKNMLKTVSLVREISQILDLQAGVASLSTGISPASIWDNTQTLEQMVTIHAEFPNAVNHTEIEEAFDTLVNRASQYAGRPRK